MKVEEIQQFKEDPVLLSALTQWLFQLADDELVIGHRDSEWLGLCPDIEGDVSFCSIAQDEVGHALFFLECIHQLGLPHPDQLAFQRASAEWRNATLLEQPNGDWAYSIVRHYLYDVFDQIRLQSMLVSSYLPLRQGATKMLREEKYHLLHMETLFLTLSQAGGEARERIEEAIRQVWVDVADLFSMGSLDDEAALLEANVISCTMDEMRGQWVDRLKARFAECDLLWPGDIPFPVHNGRKGDHYPCHQQFVQTLSEVNAMDPLARW